LFLPPGSPELNPTEHLWDHVRENHFSNRAFDSIDEVEAVLIETFGNIYRNPSSIQSIVGFNWMKLGFIH
jgi:transposase